MRYVPTLAKLVPVKVLSKSSFAPAAQSVAHHDDLFHLQKLYRELDRRRNTVTTGSGFEWGDQGGDITDYEDFSRCNVEDLRGSTRLSEQEMTIT